VRPYILHHAAETEYLDAIRYYAGINLELGGKFYDEMERLITDVRRDPELFRVYDPPARRHFSRRFPYAILYIPEPERILIVAVMDMRRKPGYWKKRLE